MKKVCFLIGMWLVSVSLSMAAAPTAPSNVRSTSHNISVSSTEDIIDVSWQSSTDSDGDLKGYRIQWDQSPTTQTQMTITLGAEQTSTSSPPLDDGVSWYFHIQAFDSNFNRSATVHLGPFIIDTQPNITAVSPDSGGPGTDTIITITGTDFISGASVQIGDVSLKTVNVMNPTKIEAVIPFGWNPGTYNMTVINPNKKNDTKNSCFTIKPFGDMNDDKAISLADAILSLKIISGLTPAELKLTSNSDVNSDKRIGLEEVVYVLRAVSGNIP